MPVTGGLAGRQHDALGIQASAGDRQDVLADSLDFIVGEFREDWQGQTASRDVFSDGQAGGFGGKSRLPMQRNGIVDRARDVGFLKLRGNSVTPIAENRVLVINVL